MAAGGLVVGRCVVFPIAWHQSVVQDLVSGTSNIAIHKHTSVADDLAAWGTFVHLLRPPFLVVGDLVASAVLHRTPLSPRRSGSNLLGAIEHT